MVRKFYVRFNKGFAASIIQASAYIGFIERGVEVVPFEDLDGLDDLGPEVGVAGYIGDVWKALDKIGVPRPSPFDYPERLRPFLGRKVWQGTCKDALALYEQKLFVKSVHQKLLTGFAFTGAYRDKIRLAGIPDEEPMWFSEVVDFVSEYRCFVLRGEVLDARRYKGDWSKAIDRQVVEAAVAAWPEAPAAYTLDMGVTSEGHTLLVEVNDGFAMGCYGLSPNYYAQMLEARWEEMTAQCGVGGQK